VVVPPSSGTQPRYTSARSHTPCLSLSLTCTRIHSHRQSHALASHTPLSLSPPGLIQFLASCSTGHTLPLCVLQVPAWVRALLLLRHHLAGHRMARQGSPLMRLVVMEAVRDEEVVGGRCPGLGALGGRARAQHLTAVVQRKWLYAVTRHAHGAWCLARGHGLVQTDPV
jgi:hypothetical protein